MKLSIIVPVYNVSQYLEDCLNSILDQDIDDYELICIDDRSTDDSLDILRKFEKKHPNLKVYSNEHNRTASYCRKFGVTIASGEYIMFVDSDDELVPGICKKLVKQMDAKKLDILHFDTDIRAEADVSADAVKWFKKFSRPYYGELRGNMVFEGCFSKKWYRFNIWNKIYRASICKESFKHIDEGRYPKAQDLYAFFIIAFLAKSYQGIREKGYVYHYGRGITGQKSKHIENFRRICTQSKVTERCKEFLIQKNAYGRYRDEFVAIEKDLLSECLSHWDRMDEDSKPECSDILLEYWKDSDVFYRAYLGVRRCDLEPFHVKKNLANQNEIINIVFAINESYIQYLSVTLHSILFNKKCLNIFRIHILHEYLSVDTLNYFHSLERPDFQIVPLSVSKFVKEYNLKPRNHIGIEMYYRLFIPDVIPEVNKVIYLDADLVVNNDLIELYNVNLNGNIMGAVYNGTINHSAKKIIAKIGTDPRKYINSGVLLIDVQKFKSNNVKNQCLEILTGNENFSNPDQDALNKVCNGKILLLPLKWNYIWLYNLLYMREKDEEFKKYCEYYMENCSSPYIIHYAGKDKPWNSERGFINPKLYNIFWNYASRSPYYKRLQSMRRSRKYPENSFCGLFVKDKKGYDYYRSINRHRYAPELCMWYEQKTGDKLNLINPKTFNEKIQWLKIFDSTPLKTELADKYLSRKWITDRIGKDYTVPLIGVWNSIEEINFDTLPNKFVLKANHGSGWNCVVENKNTILYEKMKLELGLWMERDYSFSSGFEMHYQDIERKIIAEEFIGDGSGLVDYRFFCFNGVPRQIWVDKYSGTRNHIREIFDTDWNKMDFTCTWPRAEGELDDRPKNYDEMLRISKTLSEPFVFVRVDFFEVDSKLYIGELTFTPMSGIGKFNPPKYNLIMGEMLQLPDISIFKKLSFGAWSILHKTFKVFEKIGERSKMIRKEESVEEMRKEIESWLKVSKDANKGLVTIKLLAKAGDAWAQRILAKMYAEGDIVNKDADKALNLMRQAAASGNITAKKQLVDILVKSRDEKFNGEIFSLRLELAEEGEITPMTNLAGMYLNGLGVERNVEESLRWARAAVNSRGGVNEEKQLVDSLVAVGTQECLSEAFSLRKKLADEGEVVTQRNLAQMYLEGEGTEKDREAAKYWYGEAAKHGDPISKEKLKELS